LAPGPGEVGQDGLKVLHYDITYKKPAPPTKKIIFQVQTTRLAKSFELLTVSVALTGPEKFLHKATCDPAVFYRTA